MALPKHGDVHARIADLAGKVGAAAHLYFRLVLIVGPRGAGKTALLRSIHERTEAPLVNVNLHLSRQLLESSARSRPIRLPNALHAAVDAQADGADTVLLDNTEILFDAGLKQDPLRLLRNLARHRTVVATWPGAAADGSLRYAAPGHPEYRSYPLGGLDEPLIVNLGATP